MKIIYVDIKNLVVLISTIFIVFIKLRVPINRTVVCIKLCTTNINNVIYLYHGAD